jgi:hypothetical protein
MESNGGVSLTCGRGCWEYTKVKGFLYAMDKTAIGKPGAGNG